MHTERHEHMAPPFAELLARAQGLLPMVRAGARDAERNHRIPDTLVQALRDADLFRLMQPARYGGFEQGFAELIDLTALIGTACGSAAWCYGLATVHNWLTAKFPLQAQEDVWGADRDALVCGSYAPAAQAAAVPGGFQLQPGRWAFSSNCQNSRWALLGAVFPPADAAGKPSAGFLLVPATDYRIDANWDTVGLAGTGSHTIVLDQPVFVPAHRRLGFDEAASHAPPGALAHANPLYRIPLLSAGPVSLVASALGMVQGSLDDFIAWSKARQTRGAVAGAGNSLSQFAHVQTRVADATAAADVARTLLLRDTAQALAEVAAGKALSLDMRLRNRRDQAYAVRLLTQAIQGLFDAVGGAGMHMDNPIQRHWRDIHAVARHVSFNWDAVSTMYGQHCLGLEPQGQY